MANVDKTDTVRPSAPPPQRSGGSAKAKAAIGGVAAKLKAFLEVYRRRAADALHRLAVRGLGRRAGDALSRLPGWARSHRAMAAAAALSIVAAIAGGLVVALDATPDFGLFSPPTVGEARAYARKNPKDADAQRDLGHALFAAKERSGAVTAYKRSLALDSGAADDTLAENLVSCFGTKEQDAAEALIAKHKLVAARSRLEALVTSRSRGVRWGAVRTLDRLEVGARGNWETAYILDLESGSCDQKRRAVEKLGEIGTRRAAKALRAAKDEDAKTGGWFRGRCLGDRIEDAERQIVARR